MKLNVLGSDYEIIFSDSQNDSYLRSADGYTDRSSKKIVIGKKEHDCELENFENYQKRLYAMKLFTLLWKNLDYR